MSRRLIPITAASVAAAATAFAAAAPGTALAAGFGCTAEAVSGTVLGVPVGAARAGDPVTCRTDEQAGRLGGLARTDARADGASAGSTFSGLRIGSLRALQDLVPQPAVPRGLDAVPVAIPGVLGATRTITADFRPAVEDLLTKVQLPDVPLLEADLVRAIGDVTCTATGLLQKTADAVVDGLKTAGEPLTSGAPVTLAGARTIPLTGLDLGKVRLPAGLTLDDPLLGPVLETALQAVVAGLPPVEVPALLGGATFRPGEQRETPDGISQDAGRVVLDVAGRTVADLTLGAVALTGLCDEPAVPQAAEEPRSQPQAQSTASPASQLAVACADAPVTLVDVAEHRDGHVSLLGAAKADAVGRRVQIVFAKTGRVVATGVVRPDGFFRAKAPLPAKAIRKTNDARYQAVLDGERSLALKLHRRMRIAKLSDRGEHVQLTGRINGPIAPGEKVVIRRKVTCDSDVVVREVLPGKDGTWRATLPAPTDAQAAIYRATTSVRGAADNPKTFPTYTLPGYVSLR